MFCFFLYSATPGSTWQRKEILYTILLDLYKKNTQDLFIILFILQFISFVHKKLTI